MELTAQHGEKHKPEAEAIFFVFFQSLVLSKALAAGSLGGNPAVPPHILLNLRQCYLTNFRLQWEAAAACRAFSIHGSLLLQPRDKINSGLPD